MQIELILQHATSCKTNKKANYTENKCLKKQNIITKHKPSDLT